MFILAAVYKFDIIIEQKTENLTGSAENKWTCQHSYVQIYINPYIRAHVHTYAYIRSQLLLTPQTQRNMKYIAYSCS